MTRIMFLLLFGLTGTVILISLGVWQVQRLNWKQELLAQIEARVASDPIVATNSDDLSLPRYAPVSVTGRFGPGHIRMLASRKSVGPVYRVIRPFSLDGDGEILVDTGWQPQSAAVADVTRQTVTLIGNLDVPREADKFTPEPDIAANVWFARDVPEMATYLDTEPVLVVLRDAPQLDLGVTPWPVDTAGIPNDHLQYAITWFSLATIWLAMTAYFLRRPSGGTVKKEN